MFSTSVDLIGLFVLVSLFFCLLIMVVFAVHNDWSRLSNRILFSALIALALSCFAGFAEYAGMPPGLTVMAGSATLLVMPLIFLYIHKWPRESWKHTDSLHFLPALGFLGYGAWLQLSTLSPEQMAFAFPAPGYLIRSIQWIVYAVVLVFACRGLVSRMHLPDADSRKMLTWINLLNIALTLTALVPPAAILLEQGNPTLLFYGCLAASALILCLFMLLNPRVLYGDQISSVAPDNLVTEEEPELAPEDIPQLRPKKIALSEDQIQYMHKKLHEFMFIRKPFLHQKYTLQQLSSDSGFPLYQLSLYLNRTLGMNFNSYINKMRIEFLLESYKRNEDKWNRYTLEAIAREIGFNNRTSFIQAFKKVTGMNPSAYFKSIHGHILKG